MKVATDINGGNCPECGAQQSLQIQIVIEDDVLRGDVSCDKCLAWITDLMADELLNYGIEVDKKYLDRR
ncbi:MAG: hypothetical protein RBS57_07965 [Desulforhabdus sp.]|jgi:Zn ribbon nucleic-acid-binding protein|nr:hypothetical protein [Desulforhabdus sp.]